MTPASRHQWELSRPTPASWLLPHRTAANRPCITIYTMAWASPYVPAPIQRPPAPSSHRDGSPCSRLYNIPPFRPVHMESSHPHGNDPPAHAPLPPSHSSPRQYCQRWRQRLSVLNHTTGHSFFRPRPLRRPNSTRFSIWHRISSHSVELPFDPCVTHVQDPEATQPGEPRRDCTT